MTTTQKAAISRALIESLEELAAIGEQLSALAKIREYLFARRHRPAQIVIDFFKDDFNPRYPDAETRCRTVGDFAIELGAENLRICADHGAPIEQCTTRGQVDLIDGGTRPTVYVRRKAAQEADVAE